MSPIMAALTLARAVLSESVVQMYALPTSG
jgi:hypothetical protein